MAKSLLVGKFSFQKGIFQVNQTPDLKSALFLLNLSCTPFRLQYAQPAYIKHKRIREHIIVYLYVWRCENGIPNPFSPDRPNGLQASSSLAEKSCLNMRSFTKYPYSYTFTLHYLPNAHFICHLPVQFILLPHMGHKLVLMNSTLL